MKVKISSLSYQEFVHCNVFRAGISISPATFYIGALRFWFVHSFHTEITERGVGGVHGCCHFNLMACCHWHSTYRKQQALYSRCNESYFISIIILLLLHSEQFGQYDHNCIKVSTSRIFHNEWHQHDVLGTS